MAPTLRQEWGERPATWRCGAMAVCNRILPAQYAQTLCTLTADTAAFNYAHSHLSGVWYLLRRCIIAAGVLPNMR